MISGIPRARHYLVSVACLAIFIALSGCGGSDGGSASGGDADRELTREERIERMRERVRDRPVPVAVAEVRLGSVEAFYSTTTSLTAEDEAVVVARTQGIVEVIFVEEGDRVTAGDQLAQLDTRRLTLEIERTRTNIRSLAQAFSRAEQLFTKKMISPDAFDEAKFALERERATLALQQYELEEATIRAPIDGVVTIRHIKLGNTLSPNNPAFEIKQLDALEAILNVPEKELAKLAEGQFVRVRVDALAGEVFEGAVERVAPEVDAQSGTFRVTVALGNGSGRLKPGMFVRVSIRYDTADDALLISRDAVVTEENENALFVVREGVAERQPVELGYTSGSDVEIRSGALSKGDQVVVTGQRGLKDGAPVRIVQL